MASAKSSTSIDEHIGKRIRERRGKMNLSQDALGSKLGVSFQQVQKYENGVNRISASRLYVMSKVLGVDLLYFFEGLPKESPGRKKKMRRAM